MNPYELGVFVGFVYWAYQSVFLIILINSRMEKNLNKVHQRLSWATRRAKPIESLRELDSPWYKLLAKYVLIVLINLLPIIFSWAYVFYVFICIMFNRYKVEGEPEIMKTFKFRMRNTDLTYEQIMKYLYEIQYTDESYEEFKSAYEYSISQVQS